MTTRFLSIAGVCSLVQSGLYIIAVGSLACTPFWEMLGQGDANAVKIFLGAYSANPLPVTLMSLAFILLGFLGFTAVAPATAAYLGKEDSGWLMTGRNIGMLCLAVMTVYYAWFLVTLPEIAAFYRGLEGGSPSLPGFLIPFRQPSSLISWFMFFGMGIWVLAVGFTAYTHRVLPGSFLFVCLIKVMGFWAAHAGLIFQSRMLILIGAVTGGLIGGPIYHLWLGRVMRREVLDA